MDESRSLNLQTRSGCSHAYQDLANAARAAKDQLALGKLMLAKKCVDGAVYLNGTLPAKVAQMVINQKGTPYVDIPLLESEGRPMLRGQKAREVAEGPR